jgi:hypothetical protein
VYVHVNIIYKCVRRTFHGKVCSISYTKVWSAFEASPSYWTRCSDRGSSQSGGNWGGHRCWIMQNDSEWWWYIQKTFKKDQTTKCIYAQCMYSYHMLNFECLHLAEEGSFHVGPGRRGFEACGAFGEQAREVVPGDVWWCFGEGLVGRTLVCTNNVGM